MPLGRPPLPDHTFTAYIARVDRAGAIVRGLLRSGRARPRRLSDTTAGAGEFIRLERHAAHGASYWVARDSLEVRVGTNFADAQALQPGFLEAMERAGAMPQKT
jgi:hypothetical protein